jgi:mono/diheme cytochrome c family protein
VRAKVEQGGGVMPSFRDMLSPQEIRDVAAFVATRAGSP